MKRGEMLTGRSVFIRCQMLGVRCQVGRFVFGVALLCVLAGLLALFRFGFGASAATDIGGQDKLADGVWQAARMTGDGRGLRGLPKEFRLYRLDEAELRRVFEQALPEDDGGLANSLAVLALPMPDGGLARFRIVDSPVLAPEMAVNHPQVKSYRGQGVDNPALTMRCSWTPGGLYALVADGARTVMVQPLAWFRQGPPQRIDDGQTRRNADAGTEGETEYVSYYGQDYTAAADQAMCLVKGEQPEALRQRKAEANHSAAKRAAPTADSFAYGETLRTYRIAFAVTQQFVDIVDPKNVPDRLNDWLNGVNVVFEKELAIRMTLASTVIYNNNGQPFSNSDPALLVNEVRSALKSLDQNSYDLGHVLGTGVGGNAYVGVVGETLSDSTGPYKAGGATLLNAPTTAGNPIDLIALMHEIGHQFGATHTFNGTKGSCGTGGRTGDTAFETGSGLTIMSLGGACSAPPAITDDIVSARSSYFHSGSLGQVIEYLDSFGINSGTVTATGNNPPVINQMASTIGYYVIPKKTPFELTATVTDAVGQTLKYTWEQIDPGATNYANEPYFDDSDTDAMLPITTRPIFRPFAPDTLGKRTFPAMTYILNNSNMPPPETVSGLRTAESLSGVARALNFRLTARDGVGGVSADVARLEVDGAAGPFAVTSPNTVVNWPSNSQQVVIWNNIGTAAGTLINCTNVNILISTDQGQTFQTLLGNTPNDGIQLVTSPNTLTTTARIKVEAVGNIFFDISDTNFTISQNVCQTVNVNPASLANGFVGASYSQTITASGGTEPYSFFVSDGTLPNGLMLSSGGALSGNPTATGVFNFSILAIDSTGCNGTRAYTVVISGSGLMFYPLSSPVKLLDTRPGQTGCFTPGVQIASNTELTQVARGTCSLPSTVVAVTGNVTVYTPAANGFLTLFPSDAARPLVANTNYLANKTLGNVFTVGLGAMDGAFKIYALSAAHVEVDITGYYAPPDANAMYFHPLPAPVRLLDTRPGQTACTAPGAVLATNSETLQQGNNICGIPSTALALVGNATTVGPAALGNLILFREDVARPSITSGNYESTQTLNSPFQVAVSPTTGQFRIYTSAQTNLVIDILGYYSPDATDTTSGTGLLYSPLTPIRLLDTRTGQSACTTPGVPLPAQTDVPQAARNFCTIAGTAQAIVGNATVVTPTANGYLTLWPSNATRPIAATSNFVAGINFNRYFTVGLGTDGAFKMYAHTSTHLVIDISGYFAP